jgi:single-strand DNA-binding protein
MNRYTAIGNLTQDPVCRDVGNSKVCNFAIAINEFYYVNNEKKQTTLFLDVETWSRQAENCVKFLSKGKKVAIDGKLKANSWEKNGKKYSKILCVADKVNFLASDDQSLNTNKPSKEEVREMENFEEKVENYEDDLDDINNIPF